MRKAAQASHAVVASNGPNASRQGPELFNEHTLGTFAGLSAAVLFVANGLRIASGGTLSAPWIGLAVAIAISFTIVGTQPDDRPPARKFMLAILNAFLVFTTACGTNELVATTPVGTGPQKVVDARSKTLARAEVLLEVTEDSPVTKAHRAALEATLNKLEALEDQPASAEKKPLQSAVPFFSSWFQSPPDEVAIDNRVLDVIGRIHKELERRHPAPPGIR